jgi:hypothetical protein
VGAECLWGLCDADLWLGVDVAVLSDAVCYCRFAVNVNPVEVPLMNLASICCPAGGLASQC